MRTAGWHEVVQVLKILEAFQRGIAVKMFRYAKTIISAIFEDVYFVSAKSWKVLKAFGVHDARALTIMAH